MVLLCQTSFPLGVGILVSVSLVAMAHVEYPSRKSRYIAFITTASSSTISGYPSAPFLYPRSVIYELSKSRCIGGTSFGKCTLWGFRALCINHSSILQREAAAGGFKPGKENAPSGKRIFFVLKVILFFNGRRQRGDLNLAKKMHPLKKEYSLYDS